ncbi:MAG: hypothetical protein ABI221_02470 [Candidatus Saccharimonadales bacterium]
MSNALLTRPEVIAPVAEAQQQNDHRFFDPRSPEQPEQVLGIETEAILRLSRAATALGALPPRVNLGLYALPDAVRLVPLVQEMQLGATLAPEDVRPYRKPIKKLSMEVGFADKAAATAGALAVGIPLRRALNRKIEREFPVRAAEAIDKAREAVASIEREVDFVASFENPKEQFVTEINALAETVSTAITQQRDRRVRSNVQVEAEPETPRGIAGFFTKAVRKVRSFFGMFSRNKLAVNPEITAYDAGAGIEQTLGSLSRNQGAAESRFPMLSKLVLDRLPSNMPLTKDRLALVAPEILNFLFSTSPDDERGNRLIDSVNRNPHELRFVTRLKKHYGRYSLEGIQRASNTLLPAIRDVLPTEGAKVRETFAQAQELLQRKQPDDEVIGDEESATAQPESVRKGFRNRLKKLFRKSNR